MRLTRALFFKITFERSRVAEPVRASWKVPMASPIASNEGVGVGKKRFPDMEARISSALVNNLESYSRPNGITNTAIMIFKTFFILF